jgi:hypothetical protein
MLTLALIDYFGTWWNDLDLAKQVFYGLALIASFIALILAVLAIIGMEHHDAVDAVGSTGLDDGGGGIFSLKPLTGFFLGFGWAGGIALSRGFTIPVAILIALVCGGAIMAVIVLMFRTILGLRSDGTMRIADAVGAVGSVYVTLPAGKAGGGQVVVSFRNRQETLAALNTADRSIPSGEKIRVVGVVDSRTVLVEPL